MGQKKMAYRGLRRQALEKTGTPGSSAANSRTTSRNVSRHGSDDEDGNLSDSTNMRYVGSASKFKREIVT